jgi:hypothetical protein
MAAISCKTAYLFKSPKAALLALGLSLIFDHPFFGLTEGV